MLSQAREVAVIHSERLCSSLEQAARPARCLCDTALPLLSDNAGLSGEAELPSASGAASPLAVDKGDFSGLHEATLHGAPTALDRRRSLASGTDYAHVHPGGGRSSPIWLSPEALEMTVGALPRRSSSV